jgi:hypothetical protein
MSPETSPSDPVTIVKVRRGSASFVSRHDFHGLGEHQQLAIGIVDEIRL